MKTLYALVKDRLEDEDDRDILWDDDITRKLADFQKVAVRQAVQITRDFGGSFVADVVGLGKELHRCSHREALRAYRPRPPPHHLSRAVGGDVGTVQRCVPAECSRALNGLPVRGRQRQGEHPVGRRQVPRPRLCPRGREPQLPLLRYSAIQDSASISRHGRTQVLAS